MGKPISLFSGYSQKENRTTNYCLLVLKMIYEENPYIFAEALSGLIGYDISEYIGVSFRQQERKKASVPDGLISQKSFAIYIETKNYDWFYDEQLKNHLEALNKEKSDLKILLALGNFEERNEDRFGEIKRLCNDKFSEKIIFADVSFENYINAINNSNNNSKLSQYLLNSISEFQLYLEMSKLLPAWENRLDVVNCATRYKEIQNHKVYICPATGGSYSHKQSRYFGMYRQKKVELISLIKAVIDIDLTNNTQELLWKNVTESKKKLEDFAIEKTLKLRNSREPSRVFVLDDIFETDFIKDSPGGMFGTKKYFDLSELEFNDVEELAGKLKEKKWSDFN